MHGAGRVRQSVVCALGDLAWMTFRCEQRSEAGIVVVVVVVVVVVAAAEISRFGISTAIRTSAIWRLSTLSSVRRLALDSCPSKSSLRHPARSSSMNESARRTRRLHRVVNGVSALPLTPRTFRRFCLLDLDCYCVRLGAAAVGQTRGREADQHLHPLGQTQVLVTQVPHDLPREALLLWNSKMGQMRADCTSDCTTD